MNIFSQIKEKIAQYVDVRVKLFKITVISRTSVLLSYLIYAILGIFVTFCILLFSGLSLVEGFIALGLARWISTLIVLGIYLLVMGLLIGLRKNIIKSFSGIFIRILTEKDNDEHDDDDNDSKKA